MSDKKKILLHLDTDPHPSVFDRVVAIDSGVEELFSYGNVKPDQVMGLIHGCIFTRGPKDLQHTAVFIGGSDVLAAESLLAEAKKHLLPKFGLSVSMMLDPNGANTTAAAAIQSAAKHVDLQKTKALILGGTGPVGQRAALLVAQAGGEVTLASRQMEKAKQVTDRLSQRCKSGKITPVGIADGASLDMAMKEKELVIASGAAGVTLLPKSNWHAASVKVLIDLNAVPPLGIEGVDAMDAGKNFENNVLYGALGVGGLKMKLHRAAIARLFTEKNLVIDVETILG